MPTTFLYFAAALTFSAFAGNNFDFKAAEQKPAADFNKLEVSVAEGKAPLTVKITGPAIAAKLKTNAYSKFINCGFSVQWGDGASFPTGLKRGDACAPGFEHVFTKPGAYRIIFLITETGPTDESVVTWKGESTIKVE